MLQAFSACRASAQFGQKQSIAAVESGRLTPEFNRLTRFGPVGYTELLGKSSFLNPRPL